MTAAVGFLLGGVHLLFWHWHQTLQIMRSRYGTERGETVEIPQDIFDDSRRAKDLMQRVRGFMFTQAPEIAPFDLSEAASE